MSFSSASMVTMVTSSDSALNFPGVDPFDHSCAGLGERGLHDRVLLIERQPPEHVHCTSNDAVKVLAKQGFGLRAERGLGRIGEVLRNSCFTLGLKGRAYAAIAVKAPPTARR